MQRCCLANHWATVLCQSSPGHNAIPQTSSGARDHQPPGGLHVDIVGSDRSKFASNGTAPSRTFRTMTVDRPTCCPAGRVTINVVYYVLVHRTVMRY